MKKSFLLGLAAMLLPWTAWAQQAFDVKVTSSVDGETIVYAGDDTQNNLVVTVTDSESGSTLSANQDYVVYYFDAAGTNIVTVRDAGTYTVKIIGQGEYSLYPQKSETFTVTKKHVNAKLGLTSQTKIYGDSDQDLLTTLVNNIPTGVLAVGNNEKDNFLKCLQVDRYGDSGDSKSENVGSYKVIVSGKSDEQNTESNYTYTAPSEGDVVTLTIEPKPLTVEMVWTRAYTGQAANLSYLLSNTAHNQVYKYKEELAFEDNAESVKLKSLSYNGEIKNADDYEIIAALGDEVKNYTLANDGKTTLVISKAPLTIAAKQNAVLKKTYGDEDKDFADQFDYTSFVNNENYNSENVGLAMKAKIDGTESVTDKYKVYPYVNDAFVTDEEGYKTALTNYEISYTPVDFTVDAKTLTADMMSIEEDDLTYQGQLFNAKGKLVVTDGDDTLTEGIDYDIVETVPATAGEGNGINANTQFKVKIAGKGNYTGTNIESNAFTIAKADLTITAKEETDEIKFSRDYDGTRTTDITEYFDYKGFVTPEEGEQETTETIGLTMRVRYADGIDAGEKNIFIYKDNTIQGLTVKNVYDMFTNYTVHYNYKDQYYTIKKANASFWAEGTEAVYNANTQALGYEIKAEGVIESDKTTLFTDVTVAQKVAEGETEKVVKNVDEYDLKVTNAYEIKAAATNYNLIYDESKNTAFSITPATMTIKISDKTVEFEKFADELSEDALAQLAKNTSFTDIYPKETAFSNDRATVRNMITLVLANGAETGATGKYDKGIKVTLKKENLTEAEKNVLKNFGNETADDDGTETFIINNGTLTIGGLGELMLDGDKESLIEDLDNHDGATYEKIYLKNMQNFVRGAGANTKFESTYYIEKEKWYTLVLPFEIRVSELSKAFDYVIVNIPNTDNSNPDDVRFKLWMQEIPANTLIAFKVDHDIQWDEIDEKKIYFEDKTIVAPKHIEYAVENGNKDEAGNEFRAVYEKETLESDDDLFLYPQTGIFWPSTTAIGGKFEVYPLNGYIHFAEPTTGALRTISMENLDGSTTAINAITGDVINNNAEGWYTVGGIKLNGEPTQKGIYINNGKKVVIK